MLLLFAAGVDVNSPEFKTGVVLGSLTIGILCGLWPLFAGINKGRPVLGVVGFVACIPSGLLLGCLMALPVAFAFKLLIGVLPRPEPDEPAFDPYADGPGPASWPPAPAGPSRRPSPGEAKGGISNLQVTVAAAAAAAAAFAAAKVFFERLF